MSIMSDKWISNMALNYNMITPFVGSQISLCPNKKKILSYGLSSYGYDARISNKFTLFTNINSGVIDPKNFSTSNIMSYENDYCIIPPNSFVLATTVEYFKIPRNVLVICVAKSTYARCGIIVNVTPLEPEWEGCVTLEFSNSTPLPAKIYAKEGGCQFLFFSSNEDCAVSYADKRGKYMKQNNITLPLV